MGDDCWLVSGPRSRILVFVRMELRQLPRLHIDLSREQIRFASGKNPVQVQVTDVIGIRLGPSFHVHPHFLHSEFSGECRPG